MKALITGASSGIGLDMARYLATKKYELILVARDKEKLERIQESLPTKVTIVVADLSNEQKVKELYTFIKKENIDILIKLSDRAIVIENKIKSVRKSGLTFAPEAGSQRMRDVINKNVSEEELMKTVNVAFTNGWSKVKLYFMIGLPTETMDDVADIVNLGQKVVNAYYDNPENPYCSHPYPGQEPRFAQYARLARVAEWRGPSVIENAENEE